MNDYIPLDTARYGLVKIWLPGACVPFVLLVLQSILGYFVEHPSGGDVDHTQEAWSWFVPNVLPTLTLMLAVLGAGAIEPSAGPADTRRVRAQFYSISRWLSIGYLVILLLTIVATAPWLGTRFRPIELLTISNYWLGPIQGITAGAIGVLFTSQQRAPLAPPTPAPPP
jgi:hypothetical protein